MTSLSRPASSELGALVFAAPEHPVALRSVAARDAEAIADSAGGVAIATCQRVEVHGSADVLAAARTGVWRHALWLDSSAAIRHVVGVAVGLESAVLAEDQILHQVRSEVARARGVRRLMPELHVLFDTALRAGRRGRSWRPGPPRSLADLAVERVLSRPSDDAKVPLLVVGAGEMGSLAVRAAGRRGSPVVVASPTLEHADELATMLGARAVALEQVGSQLAAGVRGVVVALAGTWHLSDGDVGAVAEAPLVVDLSVPGALPQRVVRLLGARHVDLDAIARAAPGGVDEATSRYRRRLEALRDQTIEEIERRLADRRACDVRAVLADRIERERAAELDVLWRTLRALPEADRAAIDGMTRHLAQRLLGEPLTRLGSDPDGRRAIAARELFDL